MNITAFVVARLNSTRLPEKHFKTIGNKPLIKWITDRLKKSKYINKIVLTTLDEPESEKFISFAAKEDMDCFLYKGEVDDVVGRLVCAATEFESDICILISGDCPLIAVDTLDKMIKALIESDKPCAGINGKAGKFIIHEGMGCVCKKEAWILADEMSKSPELREHHFPIIHRNPDIFPKALIDDEDIYYSLKHRISVDTPADLKFMNTIFDKLTFQGLEFNLKNAINLLHKNPEILSINSDVKQKGLFDKSKKYLFVATAGEEFGFGNLFRLMHLADEITREGHGASFSVTSKEAFDVVIRKGFKCIVDKHFGKDIWLNYDKVIFDINSNVNIGERIPENSIVIDNLQDFSKNAEKIIIPTTYCDIEDDSKVVTNKLIFRRELTKLKQQKLEKVYDTVYYKTNISLNCFLKSKSIGSIDESFLEYLARSHYYFAPFGYSFYEAIYLGTIPVMANSSKDGELFYKSLNLPILTYENFFEVELPILQDNSKEIIQLILK